MKRWILRIFVSVVVLLLLFMVAVQIVLWTDLPRKWVVSAIEQKLQLRVSAEEFSTGWLGHTSLSRVHVSLPLAKESFLEAESLRIDHSTLFSLLLGRPLTVKSVAIERPNLLVRQQSDGRWNVAEVADLILRAGGSKQPEAQAKTQPASIPTLPEVTVNNAIVRLVDAAGKQATLEPLTIKGRADGALVWRYDISIPDRLALVGEVAPGGEWQHRVDFQLSKPGTMFRAFVADPAALNSVSLKGRWSGRVDGNLIGRLDVESLVAMGYTATGAMNVTTSGTDGNLATFTPAGLVVTAPKDESGNMAFPPARVNGGTLVLDGRSITAQQLMLAFAGGELRVGGSYGWAAGTGKLDAFWNQLVFPEGVTHSGSLTLSVRQPWPNQPIIDGTFKSTGRRGDDSWTGNATLNGTGRSWQDIQWRLRTPELSYTQPTANGGQQTFDFSDLTASLTTRGDLLTLDSLSLPPGTLYGPFQRGTLRGSGQYSLKTGQWFAYVNGDKWPAGLSAAAAEKSPANWLLNIYGETRAATVTLKEFFLEGGGFRVWAYGDARYAQTGVPAQLHVFGWYPPVEYTYHEAGSDPSDDVRFAGHLHSELHLTKNLFPLDLNIEGNLFARDFAVKNHPIGNVVIKVSGKADPNRFTLTSSKLKLLSGNWTFDSSYAYREKLTNVAVSVQEMSLGQLDQCLAPPPNLRGTMNAQWNVSLPNFDTQRMTIDGSYRIDQLAHYSPPPKPKATPSNDPASLVQGPGNPPYSTLALNTNPRTDAPPEKFVNADAPAAGDPQLAALRSGAAFPAHVPNAPVKTTPQTTTQPAPADKLPAAMEGGQLMPLADSIEGRISAAEGILRLHDIRARYKGGRTDVEGITDASLAFAINSPRQMELQVNTAAWPLYVKNDKTGQITSTLLWAQSKLALDLKNMSASGPVAVQATFALRDVAVANVSANAEMSRRRIDLKSLTGDILGGPISGEGFYYIDSPLQSRGRIAFDNINATRLIELYPVAKGLHGIFSGAVTFSPSDPATRPAGPFAARGEIKIKDGGMKQLSFGDIGFLAYLDTNRAVLDKLHWDVAGGTLDGWTRLTWYKNDPTPFIHTSIAVAKLDIDQIVQAARPEGQQYEPMPGRLTGSVIAAGNPFTDSGRRQASGEVNLRVTDSDLVNIDAVTALYNILSVQGGNKAPTGHGFLNARLEGSRLEVPGVKYFNRGIDLWAAVTVNDIFKGTDATLEGSAAGSARPLKDLKLPFMADVDKLLSALQGNLATVQIAGTVSQPQVKAIPFADAGGAFRRFMLGEVQNEAKATAGR